MKNKKLIIIFSVLVFLTVLIVLSSTVFTLHNASINWMTSKSHLRSINDERLLEHIDYGESIFLVDKTKICSNIEKKYPYIRVVGVETKFPNKIVLHTAERESLFAIKKADDDYAVVDEFGKILENKKTLSHILSKDSLGASPIVVDFQQLSFKENDFIEGDFIKIDYVKNIIKKLSYSFREANYKPITCKGVFLSVDIKSNGTSSTVSIKTRRGIVITLKEAEDKTTDKLLLGLVRYNELHQNGDVEAEIIVRYDKNRGVIVAN